MAVSWSTARMLTFYAGEHLYIGDLEAFWSCEHVREVGGEEWNDWIYIYLRDDDTSVETVLLWSLDVC